jgi:SAM-dependent methyltransferase
MPLLDPPPDFRLPGLVRDISPRDAMFDGDTGHYLSVGLSALSAIEAALEGDPPPRRILDLPCGHGRVTRLLRARFPRAVITVSDIDHDGVGFCAQHFGAEGIASDGDFSRLELGRPFDLIWIGSLLTHLSPLMARQMLDCMVRHMTPRAALVVSSHGPFVADRLRDWDYGLGPARARGVLRGHARSGYGYRDYPGSVGYGISLISRDWLAAALRGSPLRLAHYAERGWDDHQDILVLRPADPPPRGLAALAAAFRPRRPPRDWFAVRHQPEPLDETPEEAAPAFDAAWYLAQNPDVAASVAAGELRSAIEHFRSHGEVEGRRPAPEAPEPEEPGFDAAFYLATYPDVAAAIADGRYASALAHYRDCGRVEGRRPRAGLAARI